MTLCIELIIIIIIKITAEIIIMRVRVTIFPTFIVFFFILVHIFRFLARVWFQAKQVRVDGLEMAAKAGINTTKEIPAGR